MSNDILKFIGSIAPTVATMLGGPLAGLAASVAGRILLGNDKATPDDVKDYLIANQSPDTIVKLKQIELESARLVKEHQISLERIEAEDRSSARWRETVVRDWTPSLLAFSVIAAFGYTIYLVFTGQVVGLWDPSINLLIGTIFGYVANLAQSVISYYFGSSTGSKQKSMELAQVLQGATKQ